MAGSLVASGLAAGEASEQTSTSPLPTEWVVTRPGVRNDFVGSTIFPDLVFVGKEAAHYILRHDRDMVLAAILMAVLALAAGTRCLWLPPIYRHTLSQYHLPALRDCPGVARFCSCCCGCWCPPYHPPFRLRILVHEGWNLKGTLCHIAASCGSNPPKTTSAQKVPTASAHYPVVWNEPLDLEIATADEHVYLLICEGDNVRGSVTLACAEFFPELEGALDDVMYLPERTLAKTVLGEQDQGTLVLSLYATRPGQALPEVIATLR